MTKVHDRVPLYAVVARCGKLRQAKICHNGFYFLILQQYCCAKHE